MLCRLPQLFSRREDLNILKILAETSIWSSCMAGFLGKLAVKPSLPCKDRSESPKGFLLARLRL